MGSACLVSDLVLYTSPLYYLTLAGRRYLLNRFNCHSVPEYITLISKPSTTCTAKPCAMCYAAIGGCDLLNKQT